MKIKNIIEQFKQNHDLGGLDDYDNDLYDEQDGDIYPEGSFQVHQDKEVDNLFARATKGDISILNDQRAITEFDIYGDTPIHYLADSAEINTNPLSARKFLKYDGALLVQNSSGQNPLHFMASKMDQSNDVKKLLATHKYALTTVNDDIGDSVLHIMAALGKKAASLNLKFFTLKNKRGETPHDLWLKNPKRGKFSTMDVANTLNPR